MKYICACGRRFHAASVMTIHQEVCDKHKENNKLTLPIGLVSSTIKFEEAKPIDWDWQRNRNDLVRRCIKYFKTNNYAEAAKALGMSRTTFYRIIKKMKDHESP